MAQAAGFYGLTLEQMMINGAAINVEAEDMKVLLTTDSTTPNFDTDNDVTDVDAEIGSGGGYTTGGNVLTGTEVTLSSGLLTFDATDATWPASTITSAMGTVIYADALASNDLICMNDFITAVSTTGGTLTVAWHASGIYTVDYTP